MSQITEPRDTGGHTPGPWSYGVRKDGSIWLSLGDYKTGPHYQGDLVATPDDARLICAAPDLLKACWAIVEYQRLIERGASDGLIQAYGLAFESAAEAVAKATRSAS